MGTLQSDFDVVLLDTFAGWDIDFASIGDGLVGLIKPTSFGTVCCKARGVLGRCYGLLPRMGRTLHRDRVRVLGVHGLEFMVRVHLVLV